MNTAKLIAATKMPTRRNKHFILDQARLTKAQKVLGTRTETETIEKALERVISEDEINRQLWDAQEEFVRSMIESGAQIEDVFGRLEDR